MKTTYSRMMASRLKVDVIYYAVQVVDNEYFNEDDLFKNDGIASQSRRHLLRRPGSRQ